MRMPVTKLILFQLALYPFLNACKKDPPITTTNNAPVANAGSDIMIIWPVDSVILDGSSSYDPGGGIESYLWTQVSGPSSAGIIDPGKAKAKATRLLQGVYMFELKVSDDGNLFSKDTVAVTVQLASALRIKADAGPDQIVTMPQNTAMLDGSSSIDSSGAPLNFFWRQLSGQQSIIDHAGGKKTQVSFSRDDTYRYELKVWNSNGVAYDTTTVTVKEMAGCNVTRTEVPARLNLLEHLPLPKSYGTSKMVVAGNKIFIPQDFDYTTGKPSKTILVYDVSTRTLTWKELSLARTSIGTVAAGTKIFFAGGITNNDDDEHPVVTDVIDIYDASTDVWSTAKLSQARAFVKAATVGNKVVFAGGLKSNVLSNRADIYDMQTNQWTTAEFSGEPRVIERVVANQHHLYFLGGFTKWDNVTGFAFTLTAPAKTIDIYNGSSGGWSMDNMQLVRYGFSAVSVDDKIIIAGGVAGMYPYDKITSHVEIIKLPNMERSNSCLSSPTAWYGTEAAALRNGSVVFYLGNSYEKRKFNIYNPRTGEWTLGVHDRNVLDPSVAALTVINNEVYVLMNNTLFKLDY